MSALWEIGGAQAPDVLQALKEAQSARVGYAGRWRYDGREELRRFSHLLARDTLRLWSAPDCVWSFLNTQEERYRLPARKAAESAQKEAISIAGRAVRKELLAVSEIEADRAATKIIEKRAESYEAAVVFWAASQVSAHLVARNVMSNAAEARGLPLAQVVQGRIVWREPANSARDGFMRAGAWMLRDLLCLGACLRGHERAEAVELWSPAEREDVAVYADAVQLGRPAQEPQLEGLGKHL